MVFSFKTTLNILLILEFFMVAATKLSKSTKPHNSYEKLSDKQPACSVYVVLLLKNFKELKSYESFFSLRQYYASDFFITKLIEKFVLFFISAHHYNLITVTDTSILFQFFHRYLESTQLTVFLINVSSQKIKFYIIY